MATRASLWEVLGWTSNAVDCKDDVNDAEQQEPKDKEHKNDDEQQQRAELMFEQVKTSLTESASPDFRACNTAVFLNVHHHPNAQRGLCNAIELARLASKHQQRYMLPYKSWATILLKMMVMQYPMEQMLEWMDRQPVSNLPRSMIYVLSNALTKPNQTDRVLHLLQHFVEIQRVKEQDATGLVAALNFVVSSFLKAHPSIPQVEQYIAVMQSTNVPLNHLQSAKLVSYYLNPCNHGDDCCLHDLARRFWQFFDTNRDVLQWHSSLNAKSASQEKSVESRCIELAQQLDAFMHLDPKDREDYLLAIGSELNDPERLYELAKARSSSAPAPMDYDLFALAIFGNLVQPAHQARGLANAIEIATLNATRPGFQLPPKTWSCVLLKMVKMNYPVQQMVHWMTSQPVPNVTKEMIYVLSNAFQDGTQLDVSMKLLEQFLQLTYPAQDQIRHENSRVVLGFLLDAFLKARPSIQHLESYIGFMTSHRVNFNKSWRKAIVAYYVNPLHQDSTSTSARDIAVAFATFCRKNPSIFKWRRDVCSAQQMGLALASCGDDGVRIAKELLYVAFRDDDDQADERAQFAEAVVEGLQSTQTDFVKAIEDVGVLKRNRRAE